MAWTVIIEDFKGATESTLIELILSRTDILDKDQFKLLQYLDPYGDTIFNRYMLDDLISDLEKLSVIIPDDKNQIEQVIKLAIECKKKTHCSLKFYGD
jgi:hypothetical protein